MSNKEQHCWICESKKLQLVRQSNLDSRLTHSNFEITDCSYGMTANIFKCCSCNFMQCSDIGDVLHFYQEMDDPSYEDGREGRALQSRMLLERMCKLQYSMDIHGKSLLDVGAGSGILVEEAIALGFDAEGVEPSACLCERALDHDIKLHHGVLGQVELTKKYDIVTIVDVIEHIDNPVGLLKQARSVLKEDGVILIVTPDVKSFAARLLGWKWWHFRVAHIGYFSHETLNLACKHAGLEVKQWWRPGWYFQSGYLWDRLNFYIPQFMRTRLPAAWSKTLVPVNPRDSLAFLVEPK